MNDLETNELVQLKKQVKRKVMTAEGKRRKRSKHTIGFNSTRCDTFNRTI